MFQNLSWLPSTPNQSPSCFPRPSPGLLFSQAPFLCFCHSLNMNQPWLTTVPSPSPSPSVKVPQSQEGFSHQQGCAVPSPSTPHATFYSLTLAEHVLPQRGNCVHFLSLPREKTGTALDTNSGSARAQLCHLAYVTSPLYTSVSSSVRWEVAINLRRPTLIKMKAPSSGPGKHPVGIVTTLPLAWGGWTGRTLTQLLLPHPSLLSDWAGEAAEDRKGQQGGGRMCGG